MKQKGETRLRRDAKVKVVLRGGAFDGKEIRVNVLTCRPGKTLTMFRSGGALQDVYQSNGMNEFEYIRTDEL